MIPTEAFPPTVVIDDDEVRLLDQRALPGAVRTVVCRSAAETADAISRMTVRGAPAIGVAAAGGLAIELRRAARDGRELDAAFDAAASVLARSRPTAVNLFWAIERMRRAFASTAGASAEARASCMIEEARAVLAEDVAACRAIGDFGATLLPEAGRVLTHCNAGALATAGYGTALGVIRSAHRQGRIRRVYADETRPFLQGARLTAWELVREGIPTTLITDSMAGFLMSRGEIDAVVVGADRIAANGDVVNKIGTYTVAVLAREHEVPFFVAAPLSTIDLSIPDGTAVTIEERSSEEVTHVGGSRLAAEGVDVRNPAFDVTPHRLVAAIVTERGVARAPFASALRGLFDPAGPKGA